MAIFNRIFSVGPEKTLKGYQKIVQRINALEEEMHALPGDALSGKTKEFRKRLQKEDITDLLPEAFAVVREAAFRVNGERPFDTQLMGGLAIFYSNIAEMKTGEGKTLSATLPAYARALEGKGVHIVTVNDYLAKRDAEWMGRIYRFLGLTVAALQNDSAYVYRGDLKNDDTQEKVRVDMVDFQPVRRKEAYAADIVYGTNSEFGFDYLRDNMVQESDHRVQRGNFFCIIDEVDSILIDEARTPLIISGPARDSTDAYRKFSALVKNLQENTHYNVDEKMQAATLTDEGIHEIEKQLGIENLYAQKDIRSIQHIEQALKARTLFAKDKQYVVKDGEVIIVDEFTGRLMYGRRYSEGLHQAIEAKEGLEVKNESTTLATITIQNYFRMYEHLSGMTGTALTEKEEFAKIYNLDVIPIPTNKNIIRDDKTDVIYKTEASKFRAIVKTVKELQVKGQPSLIGTISIEKNEYLSQLLSREGIAHELLNAKNHTREAEIIAQAGKRGAVTVATNMAGRGVDIVLGGYPRDEDEEKKITALGGLYVIGSERHDSRRIDNQLRGRSGRQGDPGTTQFYISLEDDLTRIFGGDRMRGMMDRLGFQEDMPIQNRMIARSIESAQTKVEGRNFDVRKHLLEYDNVVNKQRSAVYKRRREILEIARVEKELREKEEVQSKNTDVNSLGDGILELVEQEIVRIVEFHTASENEEEWDIEEVYQVVGTILPLSLDARLTLSDIREKAGTDEQDEAARVVLIDYLFRIAKDAYASLEEEVGDHTIRAIESGLQLQVIDNLWVDHLEALAAMREGIGLRGYGQSDPLVEYKREAHNLYKDLIHTIDEKIVYSIFKVAASKRLGESIMAQGVASTPAVAQPREAINASAQEVPTRRGEKIGRNDPCPCGSGNKYKKCHGK